MRYNRSLTTLIIVAVLCFQTFAQDGILAHGIAISQGRSVTLNINVVFMGISQSQLNMSSLTSNSTSLSVKYQTVLAGPLDTGVVYNFKYRYSFADNTNVTNFASYLTSIGIPQDTPARPVFYPQFNNPYFRNSTTLSVAHNTFYDANKVELWLKNNLLSAANGPGYTLFVADLHTYGIPSLSYREYCYYTARPTSTCPAPYTTEVNVHYYNTTANDPDLGLKIPRRYMTGWGGTNRFEFLDISAGPTFWTNALPIQVAAPLLGIDQNTYYGRIWTSKFAESYVAGAVTDLFAADQLYPVNYSQNYFFQIYVIDNRTSSEKTSGPKISSTINSTFVKAQLASLLEFSNVNVNVKYANVTDYPGLAKVIANSTTTIKDPASGRPVVDGQIVYDWLTTNGLGRIRQFVNVTRTTSRIDIPAFLFAFKSNYTFGFPVREFIASTSARATFAGEALGDMALIALAQRDFTLGNNMTTWGQPGKGIGFTHATVHELGHMAGLNHPFIYDMTNDFTNTVMGYYAYSLTFSQFDHDTVLRGVNDQLLNYAQQLLAGTANTVFNSGSISQAQQNIARASQLYDAMNYAAAVTYSLNAAVAAQQAAQGPGGTGSVPVLYTLLGLVIGAGIGILIGYLVFRRRKATSTVQYNQCPYCQSPLRWDPVQSHWLCDRCQRAV
jgi:hypothetical protein